MKLLASKFNEKKFFLRSQLYARAYVRIWMLRPWVYCLTCIKCSSAVYIGETGRRLADRFREHRRHVINGRNDLYLLTSTRPITHWRASRLQYWRQAWPTMNTIRSSRCVWFSDMSDMELWLRVALTTTLVSPELLTFFPIRAPVHVAIQGGYLKHAR